MRMASLAITRQKAWEILPICAIALLLVSLAVPRVVGGLTRISGDHLLNAEKNGRQMTPARARELLDIYGRSARWMTAPDLYYQMARARIVLSWARNNDGTRKQEQVVTARTAIERAISLSPVNARLWAQKAGTELGMGPAYRESVARAYVMSVLTGPYELPLIRFRLPIGMEVWPGPNNTYRDFIFRDVRTVYDVNLRYLFEVSATPLARAIVRNALARNARQLSYYESELSRLGIR